MHASSPAPATAPRGRPKPLTTGGFLAELADWSTESLSADQTISQTRANIYIYIYAREKLIGRDGVSRTGIQGIDISKSNARQQRHVRTHARARVHREHADGRAHASSGSGPAPGRARICRSVPRWTPRRCTAPSPCRRATGRQAWGRPRRTCLAPSARARRRGWPTRPRG